MARSKKSPAKGTPPSPPVPLEQYKADPSPEGYLGSIRIAGDVIAVYRVANLIASDGEKCDGLFYPALDKIELEAHLTPHAERQTLTHELWHAIKQKYQIPLTPEEEEALAGPIGHGFASALAPWLPKGALKPWGDPC